MESIDQVQKPQPFGRYELERRLALGGMAEIFLARQDGPAGFTRTLVIKRILPHYADDNTFVEMFLDEAKLAAKLSHPNIVPIFEFGEEQGAFFIAMEFVRGPDLKQLLFASQKLAEGIPFAIQAKIISGCAEALNYAHQLCDEHDGTPLNIVHRDVSPSNIIVSYDGIPKLLDFGIAKAASKSHKTQTGILKGKIPYMPPEQLMGRPVDGRVDVYALGVVLFELATRTLPFIGDSDFHLMKLICDSPTPKPSDMSNNVPEELERIICKAMEKEPDARYGSARELTTDLERFIVTSGQPVTTFDVGEYLRQLELDYGQPLGFSSAPRSSPSLARRTPSGVKPTDKPPEQVSPAREVSDQSVDGEPTAIAEAPVFDSGVSWSGNRSTLDARTGREAPLEDFGIPEGGTGDEATSPTAIIDGPAPEVAAIAEPATARGAKLPKPLLLGGIGLVVAILVAAALVLALRDETSTVTPLAVARPGTTSIQGAPIMAPNGVPTEVPADATGAPTEATAVPAQGAPIEVPADESATADAPGAQPVPDRDTRPIKARKGTVVLETDPWTEVYLGSKQLGVTPLTVSLPAGRVKLTLKNPGQGIEMPLVLKVKPGGTVSKRIKIKPGTLAVLVVPWGEVTVDGKSEGVTPISPLTLSPGKHTIEVVNPKTGKSDKKVISIQPGRTQRIKFDLN